MFSAKDMKNIANSYFIKEVEQAKIEIEKEASYGKFNCHFNSRLKDETVRILEKNGFKVRLFKSTTLVHW